ncbi:MAG: hypothetical protein QM621_14645 [Aeromicrobium sp.]|uniref:hypothetical protein n=1 Tax=Aeromicrobium sp. TaxID=1871063 RepID=UPI0039E47B7F
MDTTMLKIAAALTLIIGALALLDVNRYATGVLAIATSVLIVTSLPREDQR